MSETRLSTLQEVLTERTEQERILRFRHPGFDVMYNWFIAGVVMVLFWAFLWWGNDIRTERKGLEMVATAQAEWEADHDNSAQQAEAAAEAERKRQELEELMDAQSDAGAQMFFGIRNIAALYNYTEEDLETYMQSAFNRSEARGQDLTDVIFEDGQYTACSPHNDITPEYKALARRLVEAWHNGDLICDTAFQYAELTPYGVYLRKGYGEERWRAA